jgi:high affinity Mn2+ porin
MKRRNFGVVLAACAMILALASAARAQDSTPASDAPPVIETWSLHAQSTAIYQGDFGFNSPYQGANSLSGNQQWRETISATGFLGARMPWDGGEAYFDPEFNQGYGLSRSLGVASFPNGEAVKAGFDTPKPNVARLFLRQVFGQGGDPQYLAPDQNQLGENVDTDRLTVTAGKFAATDIFDNNTYAHDPRTQFLNLSFVDALAWDYPADAKGYTDGLVAELNRENWAFHLGAFLEPKIANERDLDPRFWIHVGTVAQLDENYTLGGRAGVLRELVFLNRADMGNLAQAAANGGDIVATRRNRYKAGFALNLEQALTDDLGLFSRLSWNDGHSEPWAFTDIDHGISLGLSLQGNSWGRSADTIGLAGAVNGISKAHQEYLAAGGSGIFVGDGQLDYAAEGVVETYYALNLTGADSVTLDYQFVANPAFNQARGPVSIFGARLHVEY